MPLTGNDVLRYRAGSPLLAYHERVGVTARVISGVASHIQVEQTEALHVSRIALMVREYLRSECVKELLSQAQDSSLTHSTLQLRATMSAIRHPCLIVGRCPSNFEGRNTLERDRLLPRLSALTSRRSQSLSLISEKTTYCGRQCICISSGWLLASHSSRTNR